jgi:hypothetical protein
LFCERCGQRFMPNESVCARCRLAPTRQWLQLAGLVTLTIAFLSNSFWALSLLPRLAAGPQHAQFRAWLRFDDAVSSYGWVFVALGLLVWSFWARRGLLVQKREWLARCSLVLLLVGGVVSTRLEWIPGNFATGIRIAIHDHPGLGTSLAWGLIVLVVVPLCLSSETRDSLLGHGRILSLVSFGVLLSIMALTLSGWSITH